MHLPRLKIHDEPPGPGEITQPRNGTQPESLRRSGDQTQFSQVFAGTPDRFEKTSPQPCEGLAMLFEEADLDLPDEPNDCAGHLARARALYQTRDPNCEADYLAAFVLDPALATREVIGGLVRDVQDDLAYVLVSCRRHLRGNANDPVARTWLGLILLMLNQDAEAYIELQQVFLQSPAWRPFLRLLVNEARQHRDGVMAHVLTRS
jgi:hypothetical protein